MDDPKNLSEPARPSWASAIEGYIALALVAALLAFIFFGSAVELQRHYKVGVTLCLWGFAWLFAYSGVKRGKGGARTAAKISVVVLACLTALFVLPPCTL